MKTMSVYGLLGKIYNYNDDLPKRILFKNRIYELDDYNHYVYKEINSPFISYIDLFDETLTWELDNFLHEQVGIIENDETKEKKLPEKLSYYSMEKIQKAKNKDEWQEERISLLEKRVGDLHIKMNDLLDYLESKGE